MKVIIDTNVFVSGIFWSGPPYKILKAWQLQKITLVISQEIFDEYKRIGKVLSDKYPTVNIDPFLQLVAINAEAYIPATLKHPISRDPDDDKFIACALAAHVKLIISGDQDLLTISRYQDIEIMTPALFVRKFLK